MSGELRAIGSFITFNSRFFVIRAKRLLATWRILVGVWGPKRWDLSICAGAIHTAEDSAS
jgi:hypothetical protein